MNKVEKLENIKNHLKYGEISGPKFLSGFIKTIFGIKINCKAGQKLLKDIFWIMCEAELVRIWSLRMETGRS